MAPNALQGLLKALADPEADPNLRRRALRAYGLFLLGLKGGLLLLLRPLGLLLLPLGLGAFWGFLRRGEEGLNAGARGP